jgi:hypothetical protein
MAEADTPVCGAVTKIWQNISFCKERSKDSGKIHEA